MTDEPDTFRSVRRGLLELAVLATLRPASRYAAEIIEALAGTPFATQEGTLYPLLGKLRRDGMLEHEWIESESGPPRKYHRLSDAGERRRAELLAYFKQISTTLDDLGGTTP